MVTALSVSSLYPVVQEINEDEYATCCCVDGTVMGRFSLGDLTSLSPKTKPPTPITARTAAVIEEEASPETKERDSKPASKRSLFAKRRRLSLSRARCEGASLLDSDSQTISTELEERKFEEAYVLTRQIFRCHASVLWECVHRESGQRYCVKIFDRRDSNRQEEESIAREVAMLELAQDDEACIVKVIESIDESEKLYLVQELMTSGNLLSQVVQQEGLSEHSVKKIAKTLLKGVSHLHELQICHNGLEPSNILLTGADDVKIADFGHAARTGSTTIRVGNAAYTSPEVLQGVAPSCASDMWSVGVLLYFCLFGHTPFVDQAADSTRTILAKLHRADYSFPTTEWNQVSRFAKQFISSLLHVDPSVRLTADEALDHPWLAEAVIVPSFNRGRRPRRGFGTIIKSTLNKLKCQKKKDHKVLASMSTNTSSPTSEFSSKPLHHRRSVSAPTMPVYSKPPQHHRRLSSRQSDRFYEIAGSCS